jgi:hypothetical protein
MPSDTVPSVSIHVHGTDGRLDIERNFRYSVTGSDSAYLHVWIVADVVVDFFSSSIEMYLENDGWPYQFASSEFQDVGTFITGFYNDPELIVGEFVTQSSQPRPLDCFSFISYQIGKMTP